jgi:hypothetical protein
MPILSRVRAVRPDRAPTPVDRAPARIELDLRGVGFIDPVGVEMIARARACRPRGSGRRPVPAEDRAAP